MTEIALQLKGNLGFVLGLAGMFTITKTLLTSLLVLPEAELAAGRAYLKTESRKLRRRLYAAAGAGGLLFAVAFYLYVLGPIAAIDAEALKKGETSLNGQQKLALAWIVFTGMALVVLECLASVWRYRLTLLKD